MVVPLTVLVVGVAVVLFGALHDRAKRQRALAELTGAPDREIPGYDATAGTPQYLLGDLAHHRREPLPAHDGRPRAMTEGTEIAYGFASPAFATHADGLAVLDRPRILLCRGRVTSMVDLLPVLSRTELQPLVLLAEDIDPEVLDTLAVNVAQDKLAVVAIRIGDADVDDLAAGLGTTVVDDTDLQAGYVPDDHLGSAEQWVSTADASWSLRP